MKPLIALSFASVLMGAYPAVAQSSLDIQECKWYPATCQNMVPLRSIEQACLVDAICDDFGQPYTTDNWPSSVEELG